MLPPLTSIITTAVWSGSQQLPATLCLAGKLWGHWWQLVAQLSRGQLLLLRDTVSALDFLVYSGSSFSLTPHHSPDVPSGPLLRTTNGTPLPTWGIRKTTVRFGAHTFSFDFLLAPVSLPILGTGFLSHHHHLLIDSCRRQVLLSSSMQPLLPPATAATSPLLALCNLAPLLSVL